MQRFAFFCCTAVLAGCSRPADRHTEDQVAMDTAASAAPAPSATISLADVAGTWRVRTTDEAGGKAVEVEMVATADTSGWTITGPDRKSMAVRVVAVAGDSIVMESGPYESFLLKGVQVTTRTASRLQDDKLVGHMVARYALKSGDSVAQRLSEGTRVSK